MRASAAVEKFGVPTASLVLQGFVPMAQLTSEGQGMPNLPIAMIPGNVDLKTTQEINETIKNVTLDMTIKSLTVQPAEGKLKKIDPDPQDIVFKGTFDEVNTFFYEKEWRDGLPIVPPTKEKAYKFLKFTNRSPDEVIGVLPPDGRRGTVWNVAVNGVMAGCRPEYMPVLLAIVEAMADPKMQAQYLGHTPGSETLITINGPIIKDLGFNYEQGALRVGFQANDSIGRFWRLYLRNVAGFLPHKTDKATFGNTFRVVLAENEDALAKIGWQPLSADVGFKAGDNLITVRNYEGGGVVHQVNGTTAKEVTPLLSYQLVNVLGGLSMAGGNWEGRCSNRPTLVITPCLAEIIAKSGWSKKDLKEHLYQEARITARQAEFSQMRYIMPTEKPSPAGLYCDWVKAGNLPNDFCKSTDPDRLLPIVCKPDDFQIIVSGDPVRNNAYVFAWSAFTAGVSKKIDLPTDWSKLLKEVKEKASPYVRQ